MPGHIAIRNKHVARFNHQDNVDRLAARDAADRDKQRRIVAVKVSLRFGDNTDVLAALGLVTS